MRTDHRGKFLFTMIFPDTSLALAFPLGQKYQRAADRAILKKNGLPTSDAGKIACFR